MSPNDSTRGPVGDHTGDRGAHDGVVELLHRQVVRGAAVLEERLLAADGVHRRLIGGFSDFGARFGRLQVHRGQDAAAGERVCTLGARTGVVAARHRILHRGDLLVRRRRVVGVERPVHAELRAGLPQRAFRPRERQRQLLRFELDQRVAGPHLAADLDEHLPDNAGGLGTDPGLVRRHESAGEVHLALDGEALGGGRPDANNSPFTAPSWLAAASRRGAGRGQHTQERAGHQCQNRPSGSCSCQKHEV